MGNPDNNHGTTTTQDRAEMKSLSLGIFSNISQLLADKGFADRPIDIVEALVFAMFIVADTYSLAKPDKEQALTVIYGFYDDMQEFFINKVIIKDHKITDSEEIQSVAEQFHDLSRERFVQYGQKFKQDTSDMMGLSCPATVKYLLENLFISPLDNEEKIPLMRPVSEKVLYFWTGCINNFKRFKNNL
jgi:hypothetical protein